MTDSSDSISRREWFRLRVPQTHRMLAQNGSDPVKEFTTATELPPNHHGMDLSQLPPMREALLNLPQVQSLFADIRNFGSQVSLMQQGGTDFESADALAIAEKAFADKEVNRVQIRYRWQDALWIDTLQRRPEGIRLVRIQHK